ncbi:Metallo-hydrolase/oxidoreductase [Aureobasidium pullulans]|uniref:Metallo-hydrolase/oxidoreductase n=1 Tax=Aureobasidium pullulans TaxID=5580 RepID=A0A4T0DSN6_AURPU|nr:Metallo-hydrolase/oxidoreductase [Aureobasidium pullulans]
MKQISVTPLQSRNPEPISPPAHWVGNPPSSFKNPWPSFAKQHDLADVLKTRFSTNRNFVPVPETRDELVKVRRPDWGRSLPDWQQGLKATWLGHAGFLVETACSASTTRVGSSAEGEEEARGIRILFDAVFSERTSPVGFFGPKRYTPTPCELSELPDVDLVVISHNHYDHLDIATITHVYKRQKAAGKDIHFFAALGNKQWFLNAGIGITADEVTECDWWDSQKIDIEGVGSIDLTCTPTQHFSGRTPFDAGHTLWSSWVVEDPQSNTTSISPTSVSTSTSPATPSHNTEGLSRSAKIGLGVGITVGLVSIIALAFFWYKRRLSKRRDTRIYVDQPERRVIDSYTLSKPSEMESQEVRELDADWKPIELATGRNVAHELST